MQALILVKHRELSEQLAAAVRDVGFEPKVLDDAPTAICELASQQLTLVITSWGVSELDGLAICRQLHEAKPCIDSLVLVVTPRTSVSDLQTVLDAGADDYLPYPLDPQTLPIRLRIIGNRVSNRMKAAGVELQLRNSIERFEAAVSGANDGLWDAQPMGKPWNDPEAMVWYSPRMKQLLGYSEEEFPNLLKSWEVLLHPEDRGRVFAALTGHIEHKQPYDVEYRLQVKSGEYRWFSARGQGMWDQQGRLLRMAGSLRDVTQTKEYETKLKQSEAKWRSLVDNAPDIIILTDIDGNIEFINRSTEEAERAIGRTVYHYVRESFWELIKEAYAALRATGEAQHFELRAHQQGGGTGWYATRLGPIRHDGKLAAVVLIATDITARKAAEEQSQQSEARWRSVVENAPDLIILTDLDGKIKFINRSEPAFQARVGRSVYDFVHRDYWEATRQSHEVARATGRPQQYEAMVHRTDGVTGWYAVRVGPVLHNGKVESLIRIASDITQRKISDEQLVRERQLLRRLLDLQERERQLVAYDIHDGFVQYLTGGLMHLEASAASGKERKGQTQADFDRGLSLLRDALAEARRLISGLRPPILDEQGVVAALEYLVNESRQEIPDLQFVNRSFFGRLAAPLEVAIFRITQEGLSNIRQHSHSSRARVELLQHGQWVRLIVRDWGCGFDPGTVYEERFGLQGIRQRARLLGTSAIIESAPNLGTSIVVDFPLIFDDPAAEG